MAKVYIDVKTSSAFGADSIAAADGTALTLTNGVRVLWDNTLSRQEVYSLLTKARDEINKLASWSA